MKPIRHSSIVALAMAGYFLQAAESLPLVNLVSVAPSPAASSTGNGNSFASRSSPDGRSVIFLSRATDLAPGTEGSGYLNLFLHQRTNGGGATLLLSTDATGTRAANADVTGYSATPDARFVAFSTTASNLTTNDTNGASDVFVRDRQLGLTVLASVSADLQGSGHGDSTDPALSADGRWLAFISTADDLVANDTNRVADLFVRDLQAQTTVRLTTWTGASVLGQGILGSPAISPDGSRVVFSSTGSNIVAGVRTISGEVYQYDSSTGVTTWLSQGASNAVVQALGRPLGSAPAFANATLSDDGSAVAFVAWARPQGSSASANAISLLLRREVPSGPLTVLSTNLSLFPDPRVEFPGYTMTPDGRYLAYVLATGEPESAQVYRWDAQGGTATLVSIAVDGLTPGSGPSLRPAISADGRFVAYLSRATNLVAREVNGGHHVYVRDFQENITHLASIDHDDRVTADAETSQPSLSADGWLVAWDSAGERHVPADRNRASDVFVRDLAFDTTELVSITSSPSTIPIGLAWTSPACVNSNGTRVAYTTFAANFNTNDANSAHDVYVRDLSAQSTLLVSANAAGTGAANGPSHSPALSADGRHVAFVSRASDLAGEDTNGVDDVYLRHLDTGTTVLISVSTTGTTSGNRTSGSPSISADGRWVAFLSRAQDLVPGQPFSSFDQAYLRDTQTGVTRLVSTEPSATIAAHQSPIISADGSRVAYLSGPSVQLTLFVHRVSDATTTAIATNSPLAVISDDSQILVARHASLADRDDQILIYNLVTGASRSVTLTPVTPTRPAAKSLAVSGDGRWVTFDSAAPYTTGDTNNTSDVFAWDTASNIVTLVSVNAAGTGAGNAASDSPSISQDGRFVAYRTFASDIVPSDSNAVSDAVVFDLMTGTNTLLSHVEVSSASAPGRSFAPRLSSTGDIAIFDSAAPNLLANGNPNPTAVAAATIPHWTPVDTDVDGLDDGWEQLHFQDLSHDGSADVDADGFTDRAEYESGTDPSDPLSRLMLSLTLPSPGAATVFWPAAPGRTYALDATSDAAGAWQLSAFTVRVQGRRAEATDPQALGQRFFRVKLSMP